MGEYISYISYLAAVYLRLSKEDEDLREARTRKKATASPIKRH